MADRSIVVRLRAEISGYRAAMNEATAATRRTQQEGERANTTMGRMVQSAQQNRAEWDQTGRTLMAFGAIAVAGFAASVKAAIDWESAWTGVVKTVDGTKTQMAELEAGLRSMTSVLPASHEEIAKVAEVAGQLGIATPNILGFTRTMIDLGETTNLSAEEAATALARFMGVMGTAQDKVSNLGSAVVALGNNFPTTEAEIVSMAQRLAAASKVVGLSEADALGLATAMSAVGIEAEAGGTAMSRVMIKIAKAVDSGGESLDEFASVANMSSSDFTAAWDADPITAIMAVVGGLGDMTAAGEGTFQALTDLGLQDVRVTNAMLSLAASGDQVTNAISMASDAFEENTALAHEAGLRYDTVEAKISMAKNSIVDAAIGMGNAFLPVVADMAQGVNDFMSMLAGLDPATQAAIGGVAGLTGATLLGAGAFFLMFPRVLDTVRAFRTLATVAPRVASALMLVGKATLPVLAVAAAVIALDEATKTTIKAPEIADVTAAMLDVSDSAGKAKGSLDEFFAIDKKGGFNPIDGIDGLSAAFDRLSGKGRSMVQWAGDNLNFLPGIDNADVRQVEASFEAIDTALANLQASGAEAQAALNWDVLVADAERAGISVERLKEMFPQYVTALQETENAQRLAGESGEVMTEQQKLAAAVAQEATEAQLKWRDALVQSAAEFVSFGGAYDDLVQSRTDSAQALADEANKVEGVSKTWQDFYDGQTISIDDYVAKLQEQLDAQSNWQDNMITIAGHVSQATFDELSKLGPEYASLIDQLAKEPERLKDIDGMFNTGAVNANAFADGIESIYMPELSVGANVDPALEITADLQNELNNRGLAVPPWVIDADTAPADLATSDLQRELNNRGLAVAPWDVKVEPTPALEASAGLQNELNNRGLALPPWKINADTSSATTAAQTWVDVWRNQTITLGVKASVPTMAPAAAAQGRATGGAIAGPGTGTSDSIPALLSNGEHVFTASDVAKAGGQSEVYRLRQAIQAGSLPAFALGGAVRARRRFASGGETSSSAQSYSNINPQPMRSSSQTITVAAPSLEGMSITGTLSMRGDGLADLIDGRIVSASNARSGAMRGGSR